MSKAWRTILECIGEDPDREGLCKTPLRAAKAMLYFTQGYSVSLEETVSGGKFQEQCNDMVIVRNIDISSLCEHHLIPFVGKIHIGYIPNGQVLGLSKCVRIANMFSRRLQVQERLTQQIAEAIVEAIKPKGVGVVIEASHLCMAMRGVSQPGSMTTTCNVLGCFKSDPRTRQEFFSHLSRTSAPGPLR